MNTDFTIERLDKRLEMSWWNDLINGAVEIITAPIKAVTAITVATVGTVGQVATSWGSPWSFMKFFGW